MTGEWIRFGIIAALMLLTLILFTAAVIGAYRFGFVLNRMHAAGMGDSLGIFCLIVALAIDAGPGLVSLKLILVVVLLWFTSPASSHFLSQVEYYTNPHLYRYTDRYFTVKQAKSEEPAAAAQAGRDTEKQQAAGPETEQAGRDAEKQQAAGPETEQAGRGTEKQQAAEQTVKTAEAVHVEAEESV